MNRVIIDIGLIRYILDSKYIVTSILGPLGSEMLAPRLAFGLICFRRTNGPTRRSMYIDFNYFIHAVP